MVKQDLTEPANYRATRHLNDWLKSHGVPGLCGVDTRALTRHLRSRGVVRGLLLPESEHELATMQHAHQMLLMARSKDPELELPWTEWHEMLGYLGIQGSVTVEVAREAARHGGEPRIGYRRQAQ